jgi:hypothetical protein
MSGFVLSLRFVLALQIGNDPLVRQTLHQIGELDLHAKLFLDDK